MTGFRPSLVSPLLWMPGTEASSGCGPCDDAPIGVRSHAPRSARGASAAVGCPGSTAEVGADLSDCCTHRSPLSRINLRLEDRLAGNGTSWLQDESPDVASGASPAHSDAPTSS